MSHQLIPDTLVQAGGWTILHSLWQGVIITLGLAFILRQTRKHSPIQRYYWSVGALGVMLAAVIGTFLLYFKPELGTPNFMVDAHLQFSSTLAHDVRDAGQADYDYLQRMFPFLIQAWLVGVAIMGIRMLVEMVYINRLRKAKKTQHVVNQWMERFLDLKGRLGISYPVELKESLQVTSPMQLGWIKPVILLPIGLLSGLSLPQVECILVHELAHIKRKDYLVNLIQSGVEVLLFFNPAVWWISSQIREEREHCCDELAVEITGDRVTMIKTLTHLEEWRIQGGQLGLAFTGGPQGLLGRVQRLLGDESTVRIMGKGLWSLLFFSMATGLLAFRSLQDDPVTKPVSEQSSLTSEMGIVPEKEIGREINHVNQTNSRLLGSQKMPGLDKVADNSQSMQNPGQAENTVLNASPEWLSSMRTHPPVNDRDTIPADTLKVQMQALQKKMHGLQDEMTKSPEMQQIRELTKKYETEMHALQEEMNSKHGDYEKLMVEHQKMMEQIELKHRNLMESEAFNAMQKEQEKMEQEFSKKSDELRKQYQGKETLLEYKLDSLGQLFESKHEAFDKKYEELQATFEKEIEAFEANQEKVELEHKIEALNEKYESMMQEQLEPLQEQMEQLQKELEIKFEDKMHLLQEQMERLYQKLSKKEEQ